MYSESTLVVLVESTGAITTFFRRKHKSRLVNID